MEVTKYCPKCHTRKMGTEFYKAKHTTDGLAGYCKECTKKASRAYILSHPERAKRYREHAKGKYIERIKEYRKEYKQRPEVKAREKARQATAEYKQKAHERYLKNKEKRLAYSKSYYVEHKEYFAELNRAWRHKNADTIRQKKTIYARTSPVAKEQRARYRKRRLERDPVFALKVRMRKTMADSFLRRGYKKNSPTQEILGCDWQTFTKHLFTTWEKRYGTVYAGEDYHIDHIIPLATAKTEEEVKKLCNYKNLQLLKPEDNLAKSSNMV